MQVPESYFDQLRSRLKAIPDILNDVDREAYGLDTGHVFQAEEAEWKLNDTQELEGEKGDLKVKFSSRKAKRNLAYILGIAACITGVYIAVVQLREPETLQEDMYWFPGQFAEWNADLDDSVVHILWQEYAVFDPQETDTLYSPINSFDYVQDWF